MRGLFTRTNLFLLVTISVFVLGIWGYYSAETIAGRPFDFWGSIYSVLGFFVLESSPPEIPNPALVIAKFLAAILLGYGFFQLVYAHVSFQYNKIKVKGAFTGHFIVIGLNQISLEIVNDLLSKKKRVVILSKEKNNYAEEAIRNGAVLFDTKVQTVESLRLARVHLADQVIINTQDDDLNILATSRIFQVQELKNRKALKPLRILIHLDDPSKNGIFKDYLDFDARDSRVDIDSFNVSQIRAQHVYDNHFPFKYHSHFEPGNEISILVWGSNSVADYFLLENIILSHAPYVKLKVIFAGTDAEAQRDMILQKHPFISQFVDITAFSLDNENFVFYRKSLEDQIEQLNNLKIAFVFSDKDVEVIERAGFLRQFLHNQDSSLSSVPVIATFSENSSIVGLLNNPDNKSLLLTHHAAKLNIGYENKFDEACRSERIIFESEVQDVIAKLINFMYSLKYELPYLLEKDGHTITKEQHKSLEETLFAIQIKTPDFIKEINEIMFQSLKELASINRAYYDSALGINARWFSLTDRKKDSNRYVARHLKIKVHFLREMGHEDINQENVEDMFHLLAPIEHQRWMAEKLVFGFRYGSLDDKRRKKVLKDTLKIHDQIIPYNQLSPIEQSKDMDMFYLIPLLNQIQLFDSKGSDKERSV